MNRTLTYTHSLDEIGIDTTPVSIRDYLKIKGFSKPLLAKIKNTPGCLIHNGTPGFLSALIHPGDCIQVQILEESASEHIQPVEMPLAILFEDEDIVVLNKPANMPIHPSIKNYTNTLANALAWYYKDESSPFVFRCLNRLDRDTSGLTVIAKNPLSAAILSRSMKKGLFSRTYYAGVKGHTPDSGTINAPIAREADSIITRQVDFKNGQEAVTHFETISRGNNYSLIKLQLETGRTHQIRVHMKHIGHPLPGDFLYHPDTTHIKRQALHAKSLSFPHPITGEMLFFDSEVPDDIIQLLNY